MAKTEQQKRNEEAQRQMDEAVPTPTQAELDAAKTATASGGPVTDDSEVAQRASTSESGTTYRNRAAKSE